MEVARGRGLVRGKRVLVRGITGQRLIGGRWVMGLTMIIGETERGTRIAREGGGSIERFVWTWLFVDQSMNVYIMPNKLCLFLFRDILIFWY